MANIKLSGLDLITVASITAASSFNLFVDNNGNGRVINAAALSAHLGLPLGATIVRSTNFTLTAGVTTVMTLQAAEYDALGYWNSNTPQFIYAPCNGYFQLIAGFRSSTITANEMGQYITQNGAVPVGAGYNRKQTNINDEMPVYTAPLIVASGDRFDTRLLADSVNRTIDAAAGRCYLHIQPLALWLPS